MGGKQNISISRFTEYYNVPQGISKEDAWKRLEFRMQLAETNRKPKRRTIPIFAIASSLAAAAVLFAIFYLGINYSPSYSNEIATNFGEVEKCWLPDSSLVELNSNSTVSYSYNTLNGNRNMLLKGDALFNVKKGSDFTVGFYGGEVKVKGTSFYVSAYSPNLLQVDCIEGSVEVTLNDRLYTLKKGDGIKSFNGEISAPYFCSENIVRKRLEGIFYWERVTLAEIDELVEFRFGYSIVLAKGLENRNFSGELDLTDLQGSLMVISMAMNVGYSIDEERKMISIDAK
jgi:ferric-dicitrate binding protein FerR (iron transport regulator)